MAQPTKPGNAERGWNDPPVFLHTASLTGSPGKPPTTAPPQRTLLNKRVAYPGMSGSSESSGGKPENLLTKNMPPPLVPPAGNPPPLSVGNIVLYPPTSTVTALPGAAPIIVPNMAPPLSPTGEPTSATDKPTDSIEVPDFGDDNQMFLYVTSHLKRVQRECQPLLSARVAEEVTKKLEVLETMWEAGKISYPVKAAMARLSIALCRRKCDIAHEIHMGLMMDYISEVGQWMVGIKRLIQEARSVAPICSPDSSQDPSPVALSSTANIEGATGESCDNTGKEECTNAVQDLNIIADSEAISAVNTDEKSPETVASGEGS